MNIELTGAAIPRLTRRDIVSFARKVLLELRQDIGVSIAFVDDETMIDLNRRFRHKSRTTDVLTFPGDELYSGEIIICVDQARRQAADEKHSIATEVRYLILHGILHSLGYDHESDHGEMNALELKLRSAVGLE
ncbi:MAG TPA: rRNA maturation RNase YbeY [Thermoanaerobaculia bacterium]|nr:rRNA maturation RNase YbeY [Thermoanaerobaculia bacterium]